MHQRHILRQKLEAVYWFKLCTLTFLTCWGWSGLHLESFEAKILLASCTVKLAYLEKVEWLDPEDAERDAICILFKKGLLHALLFSAIALKSLGVVGVRKEHLSQRNCQKVFVHGAYIGNSLRLFKHCVYRRTIIQSTGRISSICTAILSRRRWENLQRHSLTTIVWISNKLGRLCQSTAKNRSRKIILSVLYAFVESAVQFEWLVDLQQIRVVSRHKHCLKVRSCWGYDWFYANYVARLEALRDHVLWDPELKRNWSSVWDFYVFV